MPDAAKTFGGTSGQRRASARERGYDSAHERRRLACLQAADYTCAVCGRLATVADHKIPHRGNRALLEDMDNHQALCDPCHKKKTAAGL